MENVGLYTLVCVATLCGMVSLAYGDHVVQDIQYWHNNEMLKMYVDTAPYIHTHFFCLDVVGL